MKKLATACLLLFVLGATAQQGPHHRRGLKNPERELTVPQQALLMSKKMTLSLGLTDQQQEKVASLLGKHLSERQEMRAAMPGQRDSLRNATPDNRFKHMDNRLDRQIAFQRQLREILTDDQFEQWQSRPKDRRQGHRERRGRH